VFFFFFLFKWKFTFDCFNANQARGSAQQYANKTKNCKQ